MFDPAAFVAVSLMLQVPPVSDSTGFCAVGMPAKLTHVTPSLLFSHSHEVGVLVDESVNVTAVGSLPLTGDPIKLATGATTTAGFAKPAGDPTIPLISMFEFIIYPMARISIPFGALPIRYQLSRSTAGIGNGNHSPASSVMPLVTPC